MSQFVHIGTCCLHTLHNSMKHGEKASGWNVKKLLASLHRIIDESPSRRADYAALAITDSKRQMPSILPSKRKSSTSNFCCQSFI